MKQKPMKKPPMRIAFAALVLFGLVASANATFTRITYDLSGGGGGGGAWTYNYTVYNDSLGLPLGLPLEDFIVYFRDVTYPAPALPEYSDLAVVSSPTGWTVEVRAPSAPNLSALSEGFSAAGGGILVGDSLGGFGVSFNYSGSGTPGNQYYEVYDASLTLLDSGYTSTAVVPEPSTWIASAMLMVILVGSCRREILKGMKVLR